jgi:hypothetical protein
MTLIIQKPTGAKLVFRKELPADTDADPYIAAVEAADGQALESGVRFAIKNFVLCCKQDGIWDAIKASCILAGARTLNGALVPLVGTAPTNVSGNFVSGDYNRKAGLQGNGSSKLLTTVNNNTLSQDNNHIFTRITEPDTRASSLIHIGTTHVQTGSNVVRQSGGTSLQVSNMTNSLTSISGAFYFGGVGCSRSSSSSYNWLRNGELASTSGSSQTPRNELIGVFGNGTTASSQARLAFYSIGESLDLAKLDARVTDLINAFAAAIP